jgi:DNA-directed RNA polymerase subunit RPC12/RpoP
MEYYNTITGIRDKRATVAIAHQEISLDRVAIKQHTSKYSNMKEPIYKILVDGNVISRNNSYTVSYNCQTCGINREISLNIFVRKINRGGKHCQYCCNSEQQKVQNHSEFMRGEYSSAKIKIKSLGVQQLIEHSINEWNEEDDDFKTNYYLKHLTLEEFESKRSKILGIGNGKIGDLSEWSYVPFIRIFNQAKYVPILFNNSSNSLERPNYITFKCENCDNEFTHKDLEVIKNRTRILCQDCSFTNRTFKIRKMSLKNGSIILWQSIQERRFIEWCEDNSIPIKNGPKLKYTVDNVQHIYKVDFELPTKHIFIEIKDNHCWYRQQVINGKQAAKENALEKYSADVCYDFYIVFPHNLANIKEIILNKVL